MGRWGLDGMRSFEQVNVARKEGAALPENVAAAPAASAGSEETAQAQAA